MAKRFIYIPIVASGGSYDTDAQSFFTAAGISDTTQKSAVNQLVLDLKASSIWTKFSAIWPMVGGTSTTHSYNLVNPATFQLTFMGSPTHSSGGVALNGTSQYVKTGMIPSTHMSATDGHVSTYLRTNSSAGSPYDMGCSTSISAVGTPIVLISRYSNGNCYAQYGNDTFAVTSSADSRGWWSVSRASGTTSLFKNSTSQATTAATPTLPGYELYIGANNSGGTVELYSDKTCGLSSFGAALTGTDLTNAYTAIQAYQTTLGRQV